MAVGAEYMYKQGRLHISVDHSLTIRSSLDTSISPGMTMNLTGELSQFNNKFKMGMTVFSG